MAGRGVTTWGRVTTRGRVTTLLRVSWRGWWGIAVATLRLWVLIMATRRWIASRRVAAGHLTGELLEVERSKGGVKGGNTDTSHSQKRWYI